MKQYCGLVGVDFKKCGIIVDRTRNYISATPDGIDPHSQLILEIKCPFSVRFDKPTDVDYLKSVGLSPAHKYYHQVQMQMHITKVHRCDFVVWTTKGIFIQHITYDSERVAKYLEDIDFYYKNVFSVFYFDNVK